MNYGGILIFTVIIIIIVSILKLSSGQSEPIFRLSNAYFGFVDKRTSSMKIGLYFKKNGYFFCQSDS